ncbi:hypothetical protein [Tabrizicola sp.]|uniref:hypothetical protein n=1 Tax=Tabrizicola sp. TaxID=2005166 RepID=UPI0035AF5CD0
MNLPWHPGDLQGATGTAGDLFVFALEPGFSALSLFTALETLQALNIAAAAKDRTIKPWDQTPSHGAGTCGPNRPRPAP